MTPERWALIKEAFHAALQIAEKDRRAFLAARFGEDGGLIEEVESLLRRYIPDDNDTADPDVVTQAASTDGRPQDLVFTPTETPGQIIGRYKLLQALGEGGMGTVWQATQVSTHRTVALKLLSAASLGSLQARHRFQREIELAAALEHPNIARVYDSGLDQGLCYYAMELIPGVNLRQHIQDHKLSTTQILELFLTICQAVQHAHQHGVIHRDLKPSNIVVTPEGKPVVLDFGLGKTLADVKAVSQEVTAPDNIGGTPAFMAPEQAAGKTALADTRADVYSLGKILFELLTGHSAHDLSGSTLEVIHRIATDDVRRPRTLNPKLNKELEAILLKSLAHDPAHRYPTAAELAADVQRYLRHDPVSARSHSTLFFLAKRIDKRRRPLTIAAVILLLLCALAGYYGYEYYQEQSGWILVKRYDFTQPNPALSDFEFVEWLNSSPSPSWPATPGEGLTLRQGFWCWLKEPRSRGDLRIVARVRFSERPDTFALALHARTPALVPSVYHLPPGYHAEFGSAGGSQTLLTVGNQPAEPDQASATRASFGPHQRATLTFQRLDSTLSLQVDDQTPIYYPQLLPLSGPDLDRIGFRTWDIDLRVESITVYRHSLPKKANPIVTGDTLVQAGDLNAALQQYLTLASDYAATPTGELALAKACRIACLPGVAGTAKRSALRQRFSREYPASSTCQDIQEAQALAEWSEQHYDAALRECDDIFHAYPDSRLALCFARALASRRQPLPTGVPPQLLTRIARTTDLTRLNVSGLGIDDLSPLRSLKLLALVANDNALSSLAPLAGMPLRSLEIANNSVTSLEPLRGMPLSRLVCSNNLLASLEPLRGMPLEYLDCLQPHGSRMTDLEPLRHMPLRYLVITNSPVTSLEPLRDVPSLVTLQAMSTSVTSLEPLRSLEHLKALWLGFTPIESLEPLRQLRLQKLAIQGTNIRDLTPLRGVPLEELALSGTQVSDLSALRNMPLKDLSLAQCPVTSLEPLRGLRLGNLFLNGTQVSSLEPLRDLPNLQLVEASHTLITSLGPLIDRPPPRLTFESDTLPEAELRRALAAWSQRPETELHARDVRLLLALRQRDASTLRSLARTYAGHQYLHVPRNVTWEQAQALSESVGGHLLTISSHEELMFARNLPLDGNAPQFVWLGLRHRAGRDLWVDGTPNQIVPYDPVQTGRPAQQDFPYAFVYFGDPSPLAARPATTVLPFLLEFDSSAPSTEPVPTTNPASSVGGPGPQARP